MTFSSEEFALGEETKEVENGWIFIENLSKKMKELQEEEIAYSRLQP